MSKMKELYIIGAGGFGREVAWLVERINAQNLTWDLKGFLDDNEGLHGTQMNGYSVLGGCDYLNYTENEVWIICAVGSPKIRKKIVEKIQNNANVRFATLIDPGVIASNRISIGEGSIVCANTIMTVNIDIGKHVIINLQCTLGHDDVIRDFVTINPGVNVSGNVEIESGTDIGTGTKIIQGKKIGTECVIGAGAVVIRDIPDKSTAVGVPARRVK